MFLTNVKTQLTPPLTRLKNNHLISVVKKHFLRQHVHPAGRGNPPAAGKCSRAGLFGPPCGPARNVRQKIKFPLPDPGSSVQIFNNSRRKTPNTLVQRCVFSSLSSTFKSDLSCNQSPKSPKASLSQPEFGLGTVNIEELEYNRIISFVFPHPSSVKATSWADINEVIPFPVPGPCGDAALRSPLPVGQDCSVPFPAPFPDQQCQD